MSINEYARSGQWAIDRMICLGFEYEHNHPEVFGVSCSPQGESQNSWGAWWMNQAYSRMIARNDLD